ncbi:hypothetical protein HT031_002660 [Scenedesmus sp. PABB004]|nr:hypothetical protein HT031_002660 [Scenedesmus sp. PABB004]
MFAQLALLALLGAAAGAAAQGCPSATCNAYFANAMGGPVDCCKNNFNSNAKCAWGGTPVSWRRTRTCTAGGANYDVLVQGNSQGPPGSTECRCSNPSVGTTPSAVVPVSMTVQLKPKADMDIPGNDIPCDKNAFCMVCGTLTDVKDACAARGRCVAFTWDAVNQCGYLKAGAGVAGKRGWTAYVRE